MKNHKLSKFLSGRSEIMDDMTYEEINLIVIDYVYKGMTKKEICTKHHITSRVFSKLYRDYKLGERKEDFNNKVLDKNLDKLAATAAKGLTDGISAITHRIEQITNKEKSQEADGLMLSSSLATERLKNTMALFEITKHREKQDSDNKSIPKTVTVEFGAGRNPKEADKEIENNG